MAYIRRLPPRKDGKPGKWQATIRHPSGRKVTKTDALKRVVEAWAAETEAAFRNGDVASERGRSVTFRQWHERWAKARNVAATTAHEEQLRLARYVLPHWGSWPLRSIHRIDVQAWVTQLGRERGAHVTYGCYQVFRKMLADAELDGLLPVNPCRQVDLPRLEKPAPRWLTRDEYDRLLLAFEGAPQGDQWRAMVAVACHSGLRSGELAGLDVSAVDFDRGLIRVGQVMTKFGLRSYPKSNTSRRSVPCHPAALEMLWGVVSDRPPTAPAFGAPRGGRLDQSNFLKTVWHPALERAGIEPVRAYVTRHTFASWMVQAGVPLWDIAQALGHSSLAFVNRYAFLQPDAHSAIRSVWARTDGASVAQRTSALTLPEPESAGGNGATGLAS